ncbi:trichohyalin-like [Argiope bruennichi]|uniref:trichohyalin-like n=1 Tax=Argiope bruennichi TaxID=94029 RepID=UPI002494EC6D|nr:trichohyalin-like [Argiope bruennichi]
MSSEKDPFLQAKEAEARIIKLQAEIQHVKQRIQLADSEERAETEEFNKKIKESESKIKNLTSQLLKLQISRNKGLQGDEKIIAKAFRKHSREIGVLAGKSPKEAKEILDNKVLDLIKKSNALTHELNMKERDLANLKKQSKDVAWKTYSEFEVELEESDILRRVRELENDYQKVEKNLMECQIIQVKYKAIEEQLRRELMAYPRLLEELEEQHREQQLDVERLMASEARAHERREVARKELSKAEADALRARQEKEKIIAEYSKALKPKQLTMQKQSTELRDSEAAEQWRQLRTEQEAELKKYHEAFEKIKEAIGISDINEAESRFLSQQTTREELAQLSSQAEAKLESLRKEAQQLRSENEGLRGAELASPQIVLEKELEQAKLDNEEQLKRKSAAEYELERIKTLHADIKSGLWQQLQLMEKYLQEDEDSDLTTAPDEEATVIVTKIETLLGKIFEKLKDQDLEALKEELKEEEFLQKMEPTKLVPSAGARKLKPAEEEESSDDEDLEKKRTALKKEAQVYAEMKKKQQGRGRMMML